MGKRKSRPGARQRSEPLGEGFSRKDDRLPYRLTSEPLPNGPDKGSVVHLERMLDEYYEARGWDKATGWPTREKLVALGLDHIAKDLEKVEPAARRAAA